MRTICQEFERQEEKGGEGGGGGGGATKGGGEGSTNFDRILHLMQQVYCIYVCTRI